MVVALFYLFVGSLLIQSLYLISFVPFLRHKTAQKNCGELPPVSIIICAKNEAFNLIKLIPQLLKQQYHTYELVLINDASTDGTLEVMRKYQKNSSKIKVVDVLDNETFWKNKKYALTLGIKAATNEYLLFSDADCIPASKNWIHEMVNQISEEKTIVLGYGASEPKKKSFLNLLVRYETLLTAIQYFSYAKLGLPYMAVGRNLAYTKSTFFKVNGFLNHMHIQSGDDDLFIRDAATSSNTSLALSTDSFTISKSPDTLKKWFNQKRRHISTASYYKLKHKFLLGLYYSTKLLFLLLTPAILILKKDTIAQSLLISFGIFYMLIIGLSAKKLKEKRIIYLFPLLEVLLVIFQFVVFITNTISKPTHWK